ncbi:MAG: hypothetical protein D6748_00070, partial [Calditrichaeota bacterium]
MNKYPFRFMIYTLLGIAFCLEMSMKPLFGQTQVVIDQQMVATATVTEPSLIQFFLETFLIPEDNVNKLVFIDATGNGFGEDDLIKCFPSEKTYFLYPSDTAQKVMNQWQFTSNFQSVTQLSEPEVFEKLEKDKAANWILAGLLRSINQNYKDIPIKIYFERDTTAVVFEMWGYDPQALQWSPPPPPPRVPQTTYDMLHIWRSDTLFITDTTYYDQFFVYKSVADTV